MRGSTVGDSVNWESGEIFTWVFPGYQSLKYRMSLIIRVPQDILPTRKMSPLPTYDHCDIYKKS